MLNRARENEEKKKTLVFHPMRGVTFSTLTHSNIEKNREKQVLASETEAEHGHTKDH